jgi:4-hydroxyphenylpyruvate dioxygenase
VLRQNRVNLVLTTPLNENSSVAEHIKLHGDGVRDIAFQVEDADRAYDEAIKRGAKSVAAPHDEKDENGSVRRAAIHTYGDTIHSFISYGGVSSPTVREGADPEIFRLNHET